MTELYLLENEGFHNREGEGTERLREMAVTHPRSEEGRGGTEEHRKYASRTTTSTGCRTSLRHLWLSCSQPCLRSTF